MRYRCLFLILLLPIKILIVSSVFSQEQSSEIRITSVTSFPDAETWKTVSTVLDENSEPLLNGILGKDLIVTLEGAEFDNNVKAMLIPGKSTGVFDDFEFSYATDFSVVGNRAYVIDDNRLVIIDTGNPSKPEYIGSFDAENLSSVKVTNETVYLSDYNGLIIIDAKDPTNLKLIGKSDSIFNTNEIITVFGNTAILETEKLYLYGCCIDEEICTTCSQDNTYFEILDITNPSNPKTLSIVNISNKPGSFSIFNGNIWDDNQTDFLGVNNLIFLSGPFIGSYSYYLSIVFWEQDENKPEITKEFLVFVDKKNSGVGDGYTFKFSESLNEIEGRVIYSADGNNGLKRYDFYKNSYLTNIKTFGYISDVLQKNNLVYVVDNDLTIIDTNTSLILSQVEIPGDSKDIHIVDDKVYILSQNSLSIVSEIFEADIISYTETQVSLQIPTPKHSGTYHLLIYSSDIIANIPIIFDSPFTISKIEDQIISATINQAEFPFTVIPNVSEETARNYTITGHSGIPFLLPDDQISIEGSDLERKLSIKIPAHRYGTVPIHITVNNGFASIMESFNLTIKRPQFSHRLKETSSVSIPQNITVIDNNFLYQVNKEENCIIKKHMDNQEIVKWGQEGTDNGSFKQPSGIALDSDGFIYVTDTGNNRIQVFTAYGEFLTSFGEYGNGQVYSPNYISIDEDDTIFVSEANESNVKKFQKYDYTEGITKAIIVAGGGPYTGNSIWNATKTCANLAFRALIYQGINKNQIQYLSSEPNEKNNYVDYPSTIANIKYSITQWAKGESINENDDNIRADSLVIYMVDHGGDGNFRVNESEYISATILSLWFDDIQQHIPGKLIVIYDACQSGSFMKYLSDIPRNRERILITSSGYDESAIFIGNGALSFSSYFWAAIFNGKDIKDAFHSAQKINDFKYDNVAIFPQNPQINVNGNTINNETIDINAMQNVIIGNGVGLNFGLPFIQKISPEQTIAKSSSADITATGVWPKDGVSRVWAQIMPSGYTQTAINKPLIALPSVELTKTDDEMYKGTFNDFTHEGTYLIAVYAKDTNGLVSYPRLTTVIVQKPLRRRGIILMGESDVESLTAVKENAEFASKALRTQAYFDIIKIDGSSSETDCLDNIFNNCIEGKEKEILLYMIGNGNETKFVLSNVEVEKSISQDHLKTLLERVPDDIRVTIIYDGPHSQQFLEGLKPITEKNRIFVSSSSSENAFSYLNGKLSFSRYFWSMVYNGETLLRSFNDASNCIFTVFRNHQTPMIVYGRNLAQTHTFGYGIRFGDDIPLLTSVSAKNNPYDNSLHIQANNVNSLRSIEKVFALIVRKDHFQTKDNINLIELSKIPGSNNYSSTYENCPKTGHYNISVCAIDSAGNMSYPMVTTVMQKSNIYNIISTLQILSGFKEEKLDVSPFDTNKEVRIDLKSVIHMMKCI